MVNIDLDGGDVCLSSLSDGEAVDMLGRSNKR